MFDSQNLKEFKTEEIPKKIYSCWNLWKILLLLAEHQFLSGEICGGLKARPNSFLGQVFQGFFHQCTTLISAFILKGSSHSPLHLRDEFYFPMILLVPWLYTLLYNVQCFNNNERAHAFAWLHVNIQLTLSQALMQPVFTVFFMTANMGFSLF